LGSFIQSRRFRSKAFHEQNPELHYKMKTLYILYKNLKTYWMKKNKTESDKAYMNNLSEQFSERCPLIFRAFIRLEEKIKSYKLFGMKDKNRGRNNVEEFYRLLIVLNYLKTNSFNNMPSEFSVSKISAKN